jgi:hypothetical protein
MAYDQTTADLLRERKGMEQEIADLRAAGDQLQSSLSRVLAWIEDNADRIPALGYETHMSMLEGRSAIDLWTEIRRKATVHAP